MRSSRTLADALVDAAVTAADKLAADQKKKRMRRFSWFRIHNAILDDPRWRLAARISGAPLPLVEALVVRLDAFASANKPRGSLEGFSIPVLAAHWHLPNDNVLARIYAAFETPEIGWIDQDHLITFFERNPDVEDPTNAERQARHRRRVKAKKEAMKRAAIDDVHSNALRPLRTAQIRSDHKARGGVTVDNAAGIGASRSAAGLSDVEADSAVIHPNTGNSGHKVDPELWLATEAKRIIIERLQVNGPLAEVRLERWLRELNGDQAALVEIVKAADRADYIGARCHNLIVDQVKRHAHSADGQRTLPLPPAALSSRAPDLPPANPNLARLDDVSRKAVGDD